MYISRRPSGPSVEPSLKQTVELNISTGGYISSMASKLIYIRWIRTGSKKMKNHAQHRIKDNYP